MILTLVHYLVGWPVALILLAAFVSVTWRAVRRRSGIGNAGTWITPLMFGCAAIADLTALGVLPLLAGIAPAVLLLAGLVLLVRPWTPKGRGVAWGHARAGGRWLREDSRSLLGRLWRWLRDRFDGIPGDGEVAGFVTEEAVAARPVPSVRDDANLGAIPSAAEMSQVPVPDPHAALAAHIAEYRPENAADLTGFFRAHASGYLAQAHALRTLADGILNEVGLDPAFAHGIAEAGDEVSEMAHVLALVEQRFHVIYGEIMRAVDGGLILPHRAREFFSEGEAA